METSMPLGTPETSSKEESSEPLGAGEKSETGNPPGVISFTKQDFGLLILSCVFYIADIVSDVCVAVLHYKNGNQWWMIWTLTFIIAPCLITAILRLLTLGKKSFKEISKEVVPVAIPGGATFYFICNIHKGWQALRGKDANLQPLFTSLKFLAILSLVEAFMEAAPQLILQLYIIFNNFTKPDQLTAILQWGGICFSLISLSWARTLSYKRNPFKEKRHKVSVLGVAVIFVSFILIIGARVLSLAFLAAMSGYALLGVTSVHYVAMVILSVYLHRISLDKMDCGIFGGSALFAFVYIFTFFNIDSSLSWPKYVFYYILICIENVSILLVWYFTNQPIYEWHIYFGFSIITAGFLIGIIIHVTYYITLHKDDLYRIPSRFL